MASARKGYYVYEHNRSTGDLKLVMQSTASTKKQVIQEWKRDYRFKASKRYYIFSWSSFTNAVAIMPKK
jgi:hypothetical protein